MVEASLSPGGALERVCVDSGNPITAVSPDFLTRQNYQGDSRPSRLRMRGVGDAVLAATAQYQLTLHIKTTSGEPSPPPPPSPSTVLACHDIESVQIHIVSTLRHVLAIRSLLTPQLIVLRVHVTFSPSPAYRTRNIGVNLYSST